MGGAEVLGLVVLGTSLVAVAGLMLWTARAGASGSLKRNQLIGTRTRATLSSAEGWRAGHRATVPFAQAIAVLGAAGVVLMVLFVLLWGGVAGVMLGVAVLLAQSGLAIASVPQADRAARKANT